MLYIPEFRDGLFESGIYLCAVNEEYLMKNG
jgi:hypothetical protein